LTLSDLGAFSGSANLRLKVMVVVKGSARSSGRENT
jgi:hypothetical protein